MVRIADAGVEGWQKGIGMEAEVETFTGREGMGDGPTVLAALEPLLYLDQFQ